MHHFSLSSTIRQTYSVCLLVSSIRKDEIEKAYFQNRFTIQDQCMVLTLFQKPNTKKTPMAMMKEYITSELVPVFEDLQAEYLLVADADYFKALTGIQKVDANVGYIVPCNFGPQKVIYVPNYKGIFYDPIKVQAKINLGMDALMNAMTGAYKDPGHGIIKHEEYPSSYADIKASLRKLLDMDAPLTCDIETFDLKHDKADIGSITFCWNQHEGIAFLVDYKPIPEATEAPYGENIRNEPVRQLLKEFFIEYKQKIIYHNIAFDAYVLIYQLFMDHILDTAGLLNGMKIMLKNWDDTKLISYLATNSCAGNKLSLKDQAQEYAGNYAVEEIKDITKIPPQILLTYNLVDGLSTWHVHGKNYPIMIADQQLDIYEGLFKDTTVDIIQMQLTGMPTYMPRVVEVKALLRHDRDTALNRMKATQVWHEYEDYLNHKWVRTKNEKLKVKRVSIDDAKEVFNPGSGPQLQDLLFDKLELPVINLTKSKQPSTNEDSLKALLNHDLSPIVREFLEALLDYNSVITILNTFIPAMENASLGNDGWHYLFGNFNLGGTVSGRLSSSAPNLQNLPANSKYAKLIKSCFMAPPGWIFAGLDFNALEDRISALTTKDPAKLRVYTDGFDGHCLRAFAYFPDQLPGIVETVESINSIAKLFKHIRQESKAPSFALTYQGTWVTLMKNCGFSEEKAKLVEARYHRLYAESDQWVEDKLVQASKDGYVTAAFGLRVRTPLLHQVIRNNSKTPFEAQAEGRTAGNALGQSWCALNARAGNEFMGGVRQSEFKYDIRPCAQIHDAQYFLIRDDIRAVNYTNKYLVKAVEWQEYPDIAHDQVKLGGNLSIFYPDWNGDIEIPNGVFGDEIINIISNTLEERSKKSSK